MPKLSEFLTALAKKAGIDLTDPKYADVLAATIEVPDDLSNALEKNLMTEAAALANSKIRSTIRAEVYNGVDSDFNSLIEEYELDTEVKNSILGEKKAVDRVKKLASHLKEQSEKAAKSGDKTKEEALKKDVENLNTQIKNLKAEKQKEIDQLKADNETNLTGFQVKSLLGSKKYTLPEAMKPEEQVEMVYGIVDQELKSKGLKLVRENGTLRLVKEDGTDPYDDKNNKLELPTFIDGALAQRGLLKVSDPVEPGQPGNGPTPPQTVPGGPVTPPPVYQQAIGQIDQLIAEASQQS